MKSFAGAMLALVIVAGTPKLHAQVQGQWTATGFMQSPREQDAQVRLGNTKVLAAGGFDNNGNILASAEIFNGAKGSWALTGNMAAAREDFPATALSNGRILVSGGYGTGGAVLGTAELFNLKTGSWGPAGTLAAPRFAHTATLLANGTVLVAGGCLDSACAAYTAASELYSPATNSWTATGSLNLARAYHSAVRLPSGEVLVIGGLTSLGVTASTELYNPTTGTWANAASTSQPRYLHGTTELPDGKVLVTGGVITKYPMNSAELYDPASNTWALTGTMTIGVYAHTSTLLPDGTVLIAGGEGQSISCGKDCTGFIPTAAAEIFTEATGTFHATTSLNRALAYHATTALGSGQALTAGGSGDNAYCCQVVSDAESYTPLSMTFSASSLNFGFLQLGLTSPTQIVTVTNVGSHTVTFTSIASVGDYAQTNTCPGTLAPGQTCAITVDFTPTAAGTRNGTVTLSDNCPGSPRQTIALAGVGETLALGFSPASLNLGSVIVGSSATASATLINDGATPVGISAISISPAGRTFTETNTCPATLGVQQSCTLQIVFSPPDVFTYKATLTVTNSAGGAAMLPLSGTGLD